MAATLVVETEWGLVPVQGDKPHCDAEYIGTTQPHYHVDPRYMSDAELSRWLQGYPKPLGTDLAAMALRVGVPESAVTQGPMLLEMLHYRPMPQYPELDEYPWRLALEKAMSRKRMRKLLCPHQFLTIPSELVENGIATCPGHGLRWEVKSGKLVRGKAHVVRAEL